MKGFKLVFNYVAIKKHDWSLKLFLLKTKIDLYCLKIFEKIEDKFRKNCVNMAEALSNLRKTNKNFRSKLENFGEPIKQFWKVLY